MQKSFEEEMAEILEGAKPASAPLPMVQEGKNAGFADAVESGGMQVRGEQEKRDSGHPESINFEKMVQNGGKAGLGAKMVNLKMFEDSPGFGGKGRPENDGSKPLLNTKHEAFAHLIAAGGTQWGSYMQVYQCSRDNAEAAAFRLMKKQDEFGVIRRFTYLREQMSRGTVLSARERREYLASVVRTPVGSVNEHSPLAQEVTYEESEKGSRTKVKMPSKLEALKLDAQMAGELGPSEGSTLIPIQINIG